MDPDQTHTGAACSGSTLFVYETSNSLVDEKIARFKG